MTPDTAPAIEVRGLTKAYSGVDVLRGVDLEVTRGSIFALLGNGQNASTSRGLRFGDGDVLPLT